MTIELNIKGQNVSDLVVQAEAFIAEVAPQQSKAIANEKAFKGLHVTSTPETDAKLDKAARLENEHKAANKGDADEFDGVRYGTKSIKRNTWLDLKDGRVLEVKAGGRMPLESEIEKRLTKAEYLEAIEDGTEVALTIAEVVEAWAKDDVPNANEPQDDEEVEEIEEEEEVEEVEDDEEDEAEDDDSDDEEDEDEDEDDEEDEAYTLDEVKELAKEAKAIKGGRKALKEILEDYDVNKLSELDEDDLQDVAEELEDFLEENE